MTIRESIGEALSQGLCRGVVMAGWGFHGCPIAADLHPWAAAGPQVLSGNHRSRVPSSRLERRGAIVTDAGEQIVALANDEGTDVVQVELPPHDGDFEVVIEALPVAGREPMRCETWLLGAGFSGYLGRSADPCCSIRGEGDLRRLGGIPRHGQRPGHPSTRFCEEVRRAPQDIELFEEHIGMGDLVLDIRLRAWGIIQVVFSKLVGPSGLVIAIEAGSGSSATPSWCANAVLNRCENIIRCMPPPVTRTAP